MFQNFNKNCLKSKLTFGTLQKPLVDQNTVLNIYFKMVQKLSHSQGITQTFELS